MPSGSETSALTDLLSNTVLARLERLRLQPRRRFTDRRRGEHVSGQHGTSNEFSDYRDYVEGDDVRFVDWNIFARLQRPYMKLYLEEEDLHIAILVDASASMGYDGKLLLGQRLAAAFGMVGLLGGERVSVHVFGAAGDAPGSFGPVRGRASLRDLFSFLEGMRPGGDMAPEQAAEAFLARHSGRGVTVMLSDFLSFGNLRRMFNGLFSAGQEVFAVHILGPSELEPEVAGDTRLVDSETGSTVDVSANAELLDLYHAYRLELQRSVSDLARGRGGRYIGLNAADPVETILFDGMRRRGWLR